GAYEARDGGVVVARVRLKCDAWTLPRQHEQAVCAQREHVAGHPARAREPALAVDDPPVAVTCRVRPEEVRIGTALRFGHRVGRPQLLVEHGLELALLLLLGAVRREHLHGPRVWCRDA